MTKPRQNSSIWSCVRRRRNGKCRRANGARRKPSSPSCSKTGSSWHDGQPAPHTEFLIVPGTMTHDYKRHGTTTLFAALNILDGTVLGRCMQRHRHQEFIRFLNAIEAAVPAGKLIHVILDNYAAHKQPKVIAWLARHPRVTFHFTPTSCSWLNAVETFFAALTK